MFLRFSSFALASLVLVVSLALGGCAVPAMPTTLPTPTHTATTPPPTPTATPSPTPSPTPTPTPTLPAGAYPAAQTEAALRAVESQIDEIAGLETPVPVSRAVLPEKELLERAARLAFPKSAAGDEAALKAFGFLPPQANLEQARQVLISEAALQAIYDPNSKTIFIAKGAEGALLRLAYAETYADAVVYGLAKSAEPCKNDDCALAEDAARTGYAAYLTERWFTEHTTPEERSQIQSAYAATPQPAPDLPFALARDWDFPQEYGFGFMLGLSQHGQKALAAALQKPPLSTEQIIHPERYPDDAPQQVELPDAAELASALGKGWNEAERGVLGEWHTYLLLTAAEPEESRLLPHTAADAAAGWGGDAYAVFTAEGAHALLVDWRWDSKDDTNEFVSAFVRFARGRYGPLSGRECCALFWEGKGVFGVLRYSGRARRAVWAEAPTRKQAEALLRLVDAPHP